MKINNILGTKLELTSAIRTYIEDKIGSLDKYISGYGDSCNCTVEVAKITHHKKGEVFRCEVNLSIPGSTIRAEATESDLYAAIDVAEEDLKRQLRSKKDKDQTLRRRGQRSFKKFFSLSSWARKNKDERPTDEL